MQASEGWWTKTTPVGTNGSAAAQRREKLHVDLEAMARLRLLVACPAMGVAAVLLIGRQAVMPCRWRMRWTDAQATKVA